MADNVTAPGVQDPERLNALIAEYVQKREAGQAPDLEALCRQHPDLADALRSSVAMTPHAAKRTGDHRQAAGAATVPPRHSPPSGGGGSLTSGAAFGRYRVDKLLGEGAMGSVYLAEDTQLRRPVALKIPKFSDSTDDSARERFFREAQTAGTLRHANICPVYDVGEIDGQHFITMAYIGGRPLSDYLVSGKPLQEKQAIAIVRKLALALTEAHSRGIVHRDLKSANVMIDEKGEPILMDFGLAQVEPRRGEARLTQAGTVMGTPVYMSPEQVDGDPQRIGPRSDLYSLGVILYELLTAKLPFDGSIASVLAQVVTKAPRSPSELRPGLSPALEALTLQMLEKEADRRPADAAAVVRLLDKAAAAIREGKDANVALAEPDPESAPKKAATASKAAMASSSGAKKTAARKATRVDLAALASSARELIERHDYAQAVELVRGIPRDERTRELEQLLVEAHDSAEESEMLLGVIKDQVAAKKYDRLIPDLRRLLELKPGNRYAKELYATLQTYGDKGQRNFRYSNAGKLLPRESGLFEGAWMVPAIALGAFLLVSAVVYFSLGKGKTAVRVEVADALLKNGQVTLVIGDETVEIKGLSESITLTAGAHEYTVRQGDVEIVSPSQFVVRKGEQNLLRIDFGPGNEPPSVATATTTPATTPAAATPPPATPAAAAPPSKPAAAGNVPDPPAAPPAPAVLSMDDMRAAALAVVNAGGEALLRTDSGDILCDVPSKVPASGTFRLIRIILRDRVDDAAFATLMTSLDNPSVVSTLTSFTALSKGFTSASLSHLPKLGNLQIVELNNSGVTDSGWEHFASLGQLTTLLCENTAVTGAGIAYLSKLPKFGWKLVLKRTAVNTAGMAQIAALPGLLSLEFSGPNLTDDAVAELAKAPRLESIWISESPALTQPGLTAALKPLTKLKSVLIVGSRPDQFDDGLYSAFQGWENVDTIALTNSRVTGTGAAMLGKCGKLRVLTFQLCAIDDAGLAEIAKLSNSFSMNCHGNATPLGKGLRSFGASSRLTNLTLGSSKVYQADLDAFKAAMPNCKVTFEPQQVLPGAAP